MNKYDFLSENELERRANELQDRANQSQDWTFIINTCGPNLVKELNKRLDALRRGYASINPENNLAFSAQQAREDEIRTLIEIISSVEKFKNGVDIEVKNLLNAIERKRTARRASGQRFVSDQVNEESQ